MRNNALSILYVHHFLATELLTIVVEIAVLFFLVRFVYNNTKISTRQLLFAGIFASFATIPYVWFVIPNIMVWPRQKSLQYSEPFVTIVEAIWYRFALKTDWKTSFVISIVCNVASYVFDIIVRANGVSMGW